MDLAEPTGTGTMAGTLDWRNTEAVFCLKALFDENHRARYNGGQFR